MRLGIANALLSRNPHKLGMAPRVRGSHGCGSPVFPDTRALVCSQSSPFQRRADLEMRSEDLENGAQIQKPHDFCVEDLPGLCEERHFV